MSHFNDLECRIYCWEKILKVKVVELSIKKKKSMFDTDKDFCSYSDTVGLIFVRKDLIFNKIGICYSIKKSGNKI